MPTCHPSSRSVVLPIFPVWTFGRTSPREEGKPAPNIKWVQEWYYAPLDSIVLDQPSPMSAEKLKEIEPEKYYSNIGNVESGLRLPADLDESICWYLALSLNDRAKFDRATFWLDMTSHQWTISVSAAFAA